VGRFEELVLEHSAMLVSFAAALTGSRHEAEDVAQEAFARAWRSRDRFSGPVAGFGSWLRTIARNVVVDRYRRGRSDVLENAAYVEGLEEVLAATEARAEGSSWTAAVAELLDCLEALPEVLREACRRYYFDGLTAREVAERSGAQLAAVLKRLERARGQLRACVERKLGMAPL
jgi:RNA polymerase sigma-70 factor (ECF subfamily)